MLLPNFIHSYLKRKVLHHLSTSFYERCVLVVNLYIIFINLFLFFSHVSSTATIKLTTVRNLIPSSSILKLTPSPRLILHRFQKLKSLRITIMNGGLRLYIISTLGCSAFRYSNSEENVTSSSYWPSSLPCSVE